MILELIIIKIIIGKFDSIKKNIDESQKEYYLREKDLIENLTIFKHDSLFQILTKEEKRIITFSFRNIYTTKNAH